MSKFHNIQELKGTRTKCQREKLVQAYKEQGKGKKYRKWTTLVHNGPMFPEPYKPLPASVKILYGGRPVNLNKTSINNPFRITQEEAAVFLLGLVKRFKVKKPKDMPPYAKINFMNDWKQILGAGHPIKNLDLVDVTPIDQYKELEKKQKKEMSKEEKAKEKAEKESKKKIYGYALFDGYKSPIDYNVEAPIAFFSAPEWKAYKAKPSLPVNKFKTGKIKKRVGPEDVTVNGSSFPVCFVQGKRCNWKETVSNPFFEWYAQWRDPVTGNMKQKYTTRKESILVCGRDQEKFDIARNLKKNIAGVRKRYMKDLATGDKNTKIKALATYFLDTFALRPGGSKSEEKLEGGVGLLDLTCKNIILGTKPNIMIKFLGKSNVKFEQKAKIDPKIYDVLKSICPVKTNQKVFDVKINDLNHNYLSKMIPGLTAKSFRTWKACTVFERELRKIPIAISQDTYMKQYGFNMANIEVARALNHQAEVTPEQMEKLEAKRKELELKVEAANTDKQKEKAEKALEKHLHKIEQKQAKIATGTSKGNYIDPRITVAWTKRSETPLEKVYSAAIRQRFDWSMTTPMKWRF